MLVMLISRKPLRCYSLVYQGQLQFAALSSRIESNLFRGREIGNKTRDLSSVGTGKYQENPKCDGVTRTRLKVLQKTLEFYACLAQDH